MKKIEDLEREIEKLWNRVLILSGILCFTETYDLIVFLVETFGGNQ